MTYLSEIARLNPLLLELKLTLIRILHMDSHGTYSIAIKNRTLYVEAHGPFNEETGLKYKHDLESWISKLSGQPWNQIITLKAGSICTPEAEQSLISTSKWRVTLGLKKSAVVLPNHISKEIIKKQFASIYKKSGVTAAFFEDMKSAEKWVNGI